ncbi:hypothetical protein [Mariniluteicoccus flavus]
MGFLDRLLGRTTPQPDAGQQQYAQQPAPQQQYAQPPAGPAGRRAAGTGRTAGRRAAGRR